MNKRILLMSCAVGSLALSVGGAMAATDTAKSNTSGTTIGELVVTAQRKEENLQATPIAVSAFSANALSSKRLDGGQNLVLQVPNSNYTRSNFGGFNLKIRGIGVDVIAFGGTTGVSINENEMPVAANHFQDADFFDMDRVEVLRGPQGTLYGRNATGGAVDLITTKPSDTFGGYGSIQYGNYNAIKATAAINIPLGQAFALRVAGFRYVQDGFGTNTYLNRQVDGRDLGAIRATLSFKPSDRFSAYLMFENFGENDNRNRIGKQLCIKDPGPSTVGIAGEGFGVVPIAAAGGPIAHNYAAYLNQGCIPGSLYQNAAYGTVNTLATGADLANFIGLGNGTDLLANHPFQDHNLHNIESAIQPQYKANETLVQLHMEYKLTDNLKLTSITGFNQENYTSAEDYNRLVPTTPYTPVGTSLFGPLPFFLFPNGVVQDPQTGASNKITSFDLSNSKSKEYSEELRLSSSFSGKLNFSAGAGYSEITSPMGASNYYVESNTLTAFAIASNAIGGALTNGGLIHIDPNYPPDGSGHNYYDARGGGGYLKSYSAFGEVYYDIAPQLKLTLGGRFTNDQLYNIQYPISLLVGVNNGTPLLSDGTYGGFPTSFCTAGSAPGTCLIQQRLSYKEFTGRANLDWTPTLSFTDKTLVYLTYSRGYKGGGFNTPCQTGLGTIGTSAEACGYSLSYNPEFIDDYEIGMKNTMLNGSLLLNLNGFYYNYSGYQISTIVAKSSVNQNINSKLYGVEFESIYSPVRNLTFNLNVGYLHTSIDSGQGLVDQMNLNQGNPNYTLVHGLDGTGCLAPTADAAAFIALGLPAYGLSALCTGIPGTAFQGSGALSNGIKADLSGHKMPNSPEFTVSFGAQYVFELPKDWTATLRGDYYWQDSSYARVFNTVNDQLHAYSEINATLTFANSGMGIKAQLFVKNLTNAQPLTGVYLTNDTSGLFQNVFTLDPRTFGVQLIKKF